MRPNPASLDETDVWPLILEAQDSRGVVLHAEGCRSGKRGKTGAMRAIVGGLLGVAGLIAGGAPRAAGCELCAIYTGDHESDRVPNSWFAGAAEQFTSFGSLQLDGREVPNPASQSIESSTTQFILGYNFNDHFSLQANIPYIHRSFRRPGDTGTEQGSESGLGDATLVGKLLLLRRDTAESSFAWSLLGGLKFPTGDTFQLRDETQRLSALLDSFGTTHGHTHGNNGAESAIHGYDLTLGSGSFDARIGTSFHSRHKRAYFNAAVQYAICTEGDYGYRFANDTTWDGGPGYFLLSDPSYTLALEAAVSGQHKGSDTYKDQPVDSTGYTVVYFGPKLSYTWKDRLTAHIGVDFPMSVSNSGFQAVPGTRVRAGLTWTFGPGSERIDRTEGKQAKRSAAMEESAAPIWAPAPTSRFYGGAEYLIWWVKDASLPIPLVSGGPVATTHHGLLGIPASNGADSTVLYGAPHSPAQGGNDTQRFQNFSGMRLTLGYSFGDEHRFGLEASGFALQQQSAGYAAHGDAKGYPVIGIPVNNSIPYTIGTMTVRQGEDSLPFALPNDPSRSRGSGIITGAVDIVNKLQLWGAELNGVVSLYRKPSWELSGIIGFRFVELSESLNLTAQIKGLSGFYTGQSGVVVDGFSTKNQFFGGTLGLRESYSSGRLSVDVTARVSLGVNHQIQNIAGGFTSINFSAPFASGTEGIFAQPANEGRTSSDRFAVVPEAQIKIGYALTPRLRATLAYDFLYYSNVMRPGDQINRSIPKGQTFNQADPVVSTTSPSRLSKTADFFAHGVSVGMELRF